MREWESIPTEIMLFKGKEGSGVNRTVPEAYEVWLEYVLLRKANRA